ncbi:MAG: Gfo/Idh/MocA family oxidoreductase [Planctomycetales bacterium]|nr:Gfo/Idh/MocA family oxidoreductase [Planctomycetales bacterium]
MKLRVGVIGLGQAWEVRHRPALRALGDRYEIRAVCEEVGLRAKQVAQEFNAQSVDGFRALATRSDIDAILVLAPQWYGSLPILAACDAGKAVYCAAAIDLDPDQALIVKRRVEDAGVAFMAEFPRRHAPATLRLKELIATRLGPVRLMFGHERRTHTRLKSPRAKASAPAHHPSRELLELIDWCRYVVDREPSYVSGFQHFVEAKRTKEDYQSMTLDFSEPHHPGTGPAAQISIGRYIPAAWKEAIGFRAPAALQVSCENGIAFVDLPSNLIWFDKAGRHEESLESERPVGEQLLSHFHRAVTSLVRKTCDLEDAYRALQVLGAARESHQTGTRVFLQF